MTMYINGENAGAANSAKSGGAYYGPKEVALGSTPKKPMYISEIVPSRQSSGGEAEHSVVIRCAQGKFCAHGSTLWHSR